VTDQPIDVYPVGVLSRLLAARRALTVLHRPRLALYHLDVARRHAWRHARARQWRELKQTFNGYLAEPYDWPPGLRRCGSGWTRNRALRDLERRIARLS
jgi:hypothetical protein